MNDEVKRSLEKLRNFGIVAHIDAGKNTTTERILFYSKKIYKMGEVDDGSATMDWMVQEQERGITITSAVTRLEWNRYNLNLIDTPGHVDFTVEVERSLRVLDGLVVVFCAVGAVQPQSETVWRQANKYYIPRIAFVNKMDRTGANYFRVIEMMNEKLGACTAVIQLPVGQEDDFKAVIDIIRQKAIFFEEEFGSSLKETEIPEEYIQISEKYREMLFENLSDKDEEFMEKYLYGSVKEEDVISALRRTTLSYKLVPVMVGSALKNKGVQLLLNKIVELLPSPMDVPAVAGINPDNDKEEKRNVDFNAPFSGLVFKIATDPYVGKLAYIRAYSGVLSRGNALLNSSRDKKERIHKILRMHANQREEIEELKAGDLGAVVGLKFSFTGDTLTDPHKPIVFESIKFPEPVISVAIEPKTKADQEKMDSSLSRLLEEDPTFRLKIDKETGQTIISGMGELHLEIIVDRMLREFNFKANVGKPQVSYREAIRISADAEGKYTHHTGTRGQYGHVVIKLSPLGNKEGFRFANHITSDLLPKNFVHAVEKGVKDALETGIIAGYPVIDVMAEVIGGSFHETDSTELAYEVAATVAVREVLKKAEVYLKEPIMKLEIDTPEEYVGEVIGDINARRGKIDNMTSNQDKVQNITAYVPLAAMFGYATDLRSITQGRAGFSMEFYIYQEIPKNIADELIKRMYGEIY